MPNFLISLPLLIDFFQQLNRARVDSWDDEKHRIMQAGNQMCDVTALLRGDTPKAGGRGYFESV